MRYSSHGCLVCGRDNPSGMGLSFEIGPDGGARARWQPQERFTGLPATVHGGALLAVVDDAMWYAAYAQGGHTLTAEVTVRYRRPANPGETLMAHGWVQEHRGRLWRCAADIRRAQDDAVLVEAHAVFLEPASWTGAEADAGLVVETLDDAPDRARPRSGEADAGHP